MPQERTTSDYLEGHAEDGSVAGQRFGGPGRPRKSEVERRRHKLTVSLSDAERADIEKRARALKLGLSVYLRQAATGAKLMKRHEDLLYHRISRLGVRLLQLAKRAGAEGRDEEQEELERLVEDIRAIRAML